MRVDFGALKGIFHHLDHKLLVSARDEDFLRADLFDPEGVVVMPGDKLTVGKHEFEVVYRPLTDGPPPTLAEEDPFSRSLLEQAGLEARRKSSRRSDRLKKQLPPAVQSPGKTDRADAGGEDTEILGWLTDDDVAE